MSSIFSAPRITATTPSTIPSGQVLFSTGSVVNGSANLVFQSGTSELQSTELQAISLFANSSNYRRLRLFADANFGRIRADSLGTGGANYSLKLEPSGTGAVWVSKTGATDGLVLTSDGQGTVNPPYLIFARSTGATAYTSRVRLQGSVAGGLDYSAFVVTTSNATEFLIAGDGLAAESQHGQYNRTTNNVLSVLGNIYTRGDLVVGQDTNAGASAIGGIIRSGSKLNVATDVPGSSLTIQAGAGTGAAATGQILLQTPTVGASGTTQQTQATRLAIGTTSVDASVPIRLNRLTTTQINALASPQQGWMVFNTTLNLPCFYDGTAWQRVTASAM